MQQQTFSLMKQLPRSIARKLQQRRLAEISRRLAFRPEDALIIFSSGRGGSTWLTDIVCSIPGTATIWEPMQPGSTAEFDALGFDWDQYIPSNAEWPEAAAAFGNMLSGKSLSWPSTLYQRQKGNLKDYLTAERLVVKFVAANGVAPWLCKRFNFRNTPVFVMRHPMATIASRLRHGAWDEQSDHYIFPPAHYQDLNDEHREYLHSLKGLHRIHAAKWCIQHLPTIRALRAGEIDVHTLFYEDILINRDRELERLFAAWNFRVPHRVAQLSEQPSLTSRPDSPIDAKRQISFWRKAFNEQQITEMQEVLDHFEITFYSRESDTPLHDKLVVPEK